MADACDAYGGGIRGMMEALRAAEAVNHKLIGREPTEAHADTEDDKARWYAMFDAAPGVGKS